MKKPVIDLEKNIKASHGDSLTYVQVLRVFDLKSLVPRRCGFQAIQLAYKPTNKKCFIMKLLHILLVLLTVHILLCHSEFLACVPYNISIDKLRRIHLDFDIALYSI